MKFLVQNRNKTFAGRINLPASKSISNRVMIINALSYNPYPVRNLSECDDTQAMKRVLNSNTTQFDIGHAGTAMRFLTAFLSKIIGVWELTGSERMKQRPIGLLVDALQKLGAKIEYTGNDGFPPLRIWGTHLKGGILELDGSISSQYITALLLIAPTLEGGLTLRLKNRITSESYIRLTLGLMEKFGIKYRWNEHEIYVSEQSYLPLDFIVEADWSGASYWYQMAALAEKAEIELPNLELPSLQGDSAIAKWFEEFGVVTQRFEGGVKLFKTSSKQPDRLILDFTENPDVAQTLAVLCMAKKISFYFTGLETLKIKETDRIAALKTELAKFGAILKEPKSGQLVWDGNIDKKEIQKNPIIQTYKDHRMAMAFAPLALAGIPLFIEDPMVVSKSYPGFWDDLKTTGFEIEAV